MPDLEEISRQAQEELAKERQVNRQKLLDKQFQRSAIPPRFKDASLSGNVFKSQISAFEDARYFVNEFDGCNCGGIIIYGDVGTGKTHIACAIGSDLIRKNKLVMYCTILEITLCVKKSWSKSNESEFDIYKEFEKPDLLIIDEIGVQYGSQFETMVLSTIVDMRSQNKRPTILISNLEPGEIMENIGVRTMDRIIGFNGFFLEMRGDSLRMQKIQDKKG